MNDETDGQEKRDRVRRVGPADRRERIEPPSLFPEGLDLPDDDLPELNLPDDDPAALATLAALEDAVRPLRVTPEPERFPPVQPPPEGRRPAQTPAPQGRAAPQQRSSGCRNNALTAFFLLGIVLSCALFTLIWINPQTPFNPFPPPTPYIIVTATPGLAAAPAQSDLLPSPTPGLQTAGFFPFRLADTGILYITNANLRGCDWASIAGSVVGLEGEARDGLAVSVQGEGLDAARVFTGMALTFGPGGYELPLGGAPQARSYTVQLQTPAGVPLSEAITVETVADCESNVAIVNFVQEEGF